MRRCHGRGQERGGRGMVANGQGKKAALVRQGQIGAGLRGQSTKRAMQPRDPVIERAIGQTLSGHVDRQRIGALAGMHFYRIA